MWRREVGHQFHPLVARDGSYTPFVAGSSPSRERPIIEPGPARADQVQEGDPLELSNGHVIRCMTAGRRHAGAHIEGAKVLATDPAVEDNAGIDAGVVWNHGKNLRAPDIVVGGLEREPGWPGWMDEAPPLAVEYADTGQDESDLRDKIAELLEIGTRFIWVVRLTGDLRVEVHEAGQPVRVVAADEELEAPGILQNPVPVRALVDPHESNRVALRNLLQRSGFDSVEQIEQNSDLAGRRDALFTLLRARGLDVDAATRERIEACQDADAIDRWITSTATAATMAQAIPAE